MEPKRQKFSVVYFIATLLALVLIQAVFFGPHAENLSYSEFKALAKKGKVSNLVLEKQVITAVWNLPALSGVLLAGVPLEELMFAFTFGLYWSSVYEHLAWKRRGRVASTAPVAAPTGTA